MSRWFAWLTATLACALVLHLLPVHVLPGSGTGTRFWLHRLYGFCVAGGFALLLVGVGRAVLLLPWLRDCRLTPSERALFGFALGACAASTALLVLALVAGLTLVGLSILGIVALISALIGFHRPTAKEEMTREGSPRWLRACSLAVLGLWSVPHLIQTPLPNTDWDGAMYHLPLAERYLTTGVWAADPYFQHL